MPENNAKHMHTVYIKAGELFDKIRSIEDDYVQYSAISNIDIESHIDEHFSKLSDWEVNFEMIKDKRYELRQLEESRKIDCITINIIPFKEGIEDVFKKISEAL